MRVNIYFVACYLLLSSFVSAHQTYRTDDWQSAQQQIKVLISKGQYKEAYKLLKPFAEEHDGKAEAHTLMGIVTLHLGDYPTAILHLRKASEILPRALATRKLLSKAYLLKGDKNSAIPVLKDLTRVEPRDPENWALLGKIYQEQNRFPEALKALEASLRLKPDDLSTLYALAYTQFGLGNYEKAKSIFTRVVAINARLAKPTAGPHASFAMVLLRLNLIREAEEEVRKAVAIDPHNHLTVAARGALVARLRTAPAQTSVADVLPSPVFRDSALSAGLNFRLENSPTPAKHQIETMPGGVAVLDYNNDGYMDIYFTNGAESPSLQKNGPRFWNRLFRNNGNMTFTDVTSRAGVEGAGYMMGAAAGDYNNDGFTDLFVAGVDRNILYHNNGNGTFTNITRQAGLDLPHPLYGMMWSIHGGWLDYDNDGWIDLLVVNYCSWNPRNEPVCGDADGGQRAYCHPGRYSPLPNQLFRNNRDSTFTNVSTESGIGKHLGKGMGAAVADADGDGMIDIFIANDTEPNFLFLNQGHGKFEEVGTKQGVAFNQFGTPVSSMGADFRDLDNDAKPDLFVTTLSNEGFLLFRNAGDGFEDIADRSLITLPSLPLSGWSNMIVDLNNDGWKDLFSANGHALDNIEMTQSRTYRQRNSIFQNMGDGSFRDTSGEVGSDFQRTAAHRGAAVADFDNDGRVDVVVTALGDRPELWHNMTTAAGHWLLVKLVGDASNRDGIGAALRLEMENGRTLWNHVSTSVGFGSSSDRRVHFGLGKSKAVKSLEITWPSGKLQRLKNLKSDHVLTVEEPK